MVSSAVLDEPRYHPEASSTDTNSSIVYNVYQESQIIDIQTSIVYRRLEEGPDDKGALSLFQFPASIPNRPLPGILTLASR